MSHFRRGQSKVWFGNEPEHDYQPAYQSIYSSIDREFLERRATNITRGNQLQRSVGSCHNSSILSWSSRQGSPSSHKSQDSGFSDTENSPDNKNPQSSQSSPEKQNSPKNESQSSPSVGSEAPTPPTVIRNKHIRTPELVKARKLTFSAPNSPVPSQKSLSVFQAIDEMDCESTEQPKVTPKSTECTPKFVKTSSFCMSGGDDSTSWVYTPTKDETPDRRTYNNETVILGGSGSFGATPKESKSFTKNLPLPTYLELFPTNSSTPKRSTPITHRSMPHRPKRQTPGPLKYAAKARSPSPYEPSSLYLSALHVSEYSNPLLNGHALSVQTWLDDTRRTGYTEVMSTLQSKSIAVEAARNSKMASMTAVQIIRSVQGKVVSLQQEFEKAEKLLKAFPNTQDELGLETVVTSLIASIGTFLEKIISKKIYQAENENDLAKFEDNVDSILDLASDLRLKIVKGDFEIHEDISIIKRLLLIVIHSIFDRLVKLIVLNLEDSRCQLMLKTNLEYISTLSSLDYSGFASLSDAFCSNGAVRTLLLVCLNEKETLTRALALRALATVCSSVEAISQFEQSEGLDILRDIVSDSSRSEQELREGVSVLTQVTAPWHGREHRLEGLKELLESLVEALTSILRRTICSQTLLLCAACLNNLSRLEMTSIYSVMANESIVHLRDASVRCGPEIPIFLYEQVTTMVFNMSLNRKSHHHLASKTVISFLIGIFEERFYDKYETRAENEALRRTIKNLLHVFSRLIHESNMGHDILANNMVPIFSRMERDLCNNTTSPEFTKDVSYINRKLNESLSGGRRASGGRASVLDSASLPEVKPLPSLVPRQISYV